MKFKVNCIEPTEPFIYYMFEGGNITIKQMEEIEEEILLQLEDEIKEASEKQHDLIITADFTKGETQYGTGYGDIYVIPDYWNLEVIGSESI